MSENYIPKILYDDHGQTHRIVQPKLSEFCKLVDLLNNDTRTIVSILQEIGVLHICGGNSGRVDVLFQAKKQYGRLLDPDCNSDEEIEIVTERDVDIEPFCKTVSTTRACYVGTFFLEEGTFPKELTWQGEMDQFT